MRKIFTILLSFILVQMCLAGPTDSCLEKVITLSDGEKVTVRMVGDEFFCYYQDVNSDRCFVREYDSGRLLICESSVLKSKGAAGSEKRKWTNENRMELKSASQCIGERKLLAVFVSFQDKKFDAGNVSLFNRIFNDDKFDYGRYKGSVRDYFADQSQNKFRLSFDIVGPVQLAHNSTYYGSNVGGLDNKSKEMLAEIYQQLKGRVNFSDYDWDGDGTMEPLCIIFAGLAEELGGEEDDIWSHASYLTGEAKENCDNVFGHYALISEKRMINKSQQTNSIGTICHEMSHCFGLPDTYDGEGIFYGGQRWDVMSHGVHNGDGFTPAGYTALDKMLMGWQEPVELTTNRVVDNMASLDEGGDFYKITNDAFPTEFYLIENRQKHTVWDSSLPTTGVLIWHVDYNKYLFNQNIVNSFSKTHYERVALFLADDNCNYASYAGDAYPYYGNKSLTNTSVPAASLRHANTDGTYFMNKPVTNIHCNPDGTAGFTFTNNVGNWTPTIRDPYTVSCQYPGLLAQYFYDFGIRNLILSGKTNARDMYFMNQELTSLEYLDMGDCSIPGEKGHDILPTQSFYENTSLMEVVLPKVQEIEAWAFARSKKLRRVVMPDGLTAIGYCAFYTCENIEEINIPETVMTIDGYAFGRCSKLSSVNIPTSVRKIGRSAFAWCPKLTKIELPELIEVVDTAAFWECGLKEIVIPEHTKELGYTAFWNNKNVQQVVSKSIVPPVCGDFCFSTECYENAVLYVPDSSIEKYRTANIWKNFKNISSIDVLTGITAPLYDDYGIRIDGRTVSIDIPTNTRVYVYSIDGRKIDIHGKTSFELPNAGVYIICADGRRLKVVIN